MTARFEIMGKSYIAVAATPYVTGGFFTLCNVADMIANYESYCGYRNATVLSPLRVTADGQLVPIDHGFFIPAADTCAQEGEVPAEWSLAGLVVPEVDLRAMMTMLVTELAAAGNLEPNRPPASWNPDAVLPEAVKEEVDEHIRGPLSRTTARKNSKDAKLRRVDVAISKIVETAGRYGVAVEIHDMPGHKQDFIRLLRHVDRAITIPASTLDRHYFPELGLRWRLGPRREAAVPLLAVFDLEIPTEK